MKLIKTSKYKRDCKKLASKHQTKELETLTKIEALLIASNNLQDTINNTLAKIYHLEKKKGNLKELFTARLNNKTRIFLKPIGTYPYQLSDILEIELVEIDDKHYKEG